MNFDRYVEVTHCFSDLEYDDEGWCLKDGLPRPYFIVFVEVEGKYGKKLVPAWWTINSWYGRKLRDTDKVIRWRLPRKEEEIE